MNNSMDQIHYSNQVVYPINPQYQDPLNQQIQPQNQLPVIDEGWIGTIKRHKWIFIGICLFIVVGIIGIALGIYFGLKKGP
jgi:hypothetical protein